jgi:hypothetical protein
MADLDIEALSDEEVAEIVDQGLASLNARICDAPTEPDGVNVTYPEGLADDITAACNAWDVVADLLPGFREVEA